MKLTPRMEDVVLALWELEKKKKVVRVKDLETFFGIKTSSVIDFIRALKKRELVNHEKYGYIELTDSGIRQAEIINTKRSILKKFFSEVLILDPASAELEACAFEHYIKNETLKYIEIMTSFFSDYSIGDRKIKDLYLDYAISKGTVTDKSAVELSVVDPGTKGRIVKINASKQKADIFSELGFAIGEEILLESISPLGDPLNIVVNGVTVHLSKQDAQLIVIVPEQ